MFKSVLDLYSTDKQFQQPPKGMKILSNKMHPCLHFHFLFTVITVIFVIRMYFVIVAQ